MSQEIRPIDQTVTVSMDTVGGFALLQRQAMMFAQSSLVPPAYRVGGLVKENGRDVPNSENRAYANCGIALSMALRLGVDPMTVFQNMYIIQGRPSFGSTFMIGMFNKSGKYSSLNYVFVGEQGKDSYGCYATCCRLADGEKIDGPTVTIGMAKKEGWFTKSGSKWQSMPDLMLRYRAAAFLIRTITPEVTLGLLTQEEVMDIVETPTQAPTQTYGRGKAVTQKFVSPQQAPRQIQPRTQQQAKPLQAAPADQSLLVQDAAPQIPQEAETRQEALAPQQTATHDDVEMVHCPKTDTDMDNFGCISCESREGCPAR